MLTHFYHLFFILGQTLRTILFTLKQTDVI